MTAGFTESVVEDAALAWLAGTGWQIAHGPDIAPDTLTAERADYADVVLAQRNAEGAFALRDLLAFSAVCGTGLDTIPLPGDTSVGQVAAVLHEVAALASALSKPLTARLLPLPGLKAGDTTNFEQLDDPQIAQYFCATRVMRVS